MRNYILFIFSFTALFAMEKNIHEDQGVQYSTNGYGDIFPLVDDIVEEQLPQKLSPFISFIKENKKKTPIIIRVPHEKGSMGAALKKSGFELRHADNKMNEWIVKNGSSIPDPYTAVIASEIIVLKNNQLLAIEEKTRRERFGFPAGSVEKQQSVYDNAVCELKEEVNLETKKEALKLIALIHRKNFNRYGATLINYCFLTQEVYGEPRADEEEVVQCFWAPVKKIMTASEINNLRVSQFANALAQHIDEGCRMPQSKTFPDDRQTLHGGDSEGTMQVEFFAQDISYKSFTDNVQ